MKYEFLIDTYETERIKVISAWSMFTDQDLPVRPNATDPRGRSFHEHMVHQCVSEDIWFRTMLDIDVGAPPLPKEDDVFRCTQVASLGDDAPFDAYRTSPWPAACVASHARPGGAQ